MNTFQKIVLGIGLVVTILFALNNSIGKEVVAINVVWKNNLYPYKCTESEYNTLKMKSDNDCLFFDGEYFYDTAPVNHGKPAKIASADYVVINGDMTAGKYWGNLFVIIFLTCIGVILTIGINNCDWYDDLDDY